MDFDNRVSTVGPIARWGMVQGLIVRSQNKVCWQPYGETDQRGRFRLKTVHGDEGAVIGPHVVRITTLQVKEPTAGGDFEIVAEERIPARYVDGSTPRFTVPAAGTDQADFELTSN